MTGAYLADLARVGGGLLATLDEPLAKTRPDIVRLLPTPRSDRPAELNEPDPYRSARNLPEGGMVG